MGDSDSGIGNGGDTKVDLQSATVQLPDPLPDHDEATDKEDQLLHSPLRKQNSILSLTLEEIQFRSGKSFGSMNMDEFLASVWSAEDNQLLTSQAESNDNRGNGRKGSALMGKSVLARQASFSVPTPLCNKTVDEVWYEIHKDDPLHSHHHQLSDENASSADDLEMPPRGQQTLGEMTLEDFLIKAGVMQEAQLLCQQKLAPVVPAVPILKHTVRFSDAPTPYASGFTSSSLSGNGFVATAYQISGQTSNRHMGEGVGIKTRRIIDGPQEVVVERRQRRMIKNRESAARSRARKQAYTVELEVELNQLKEENEKLRRIVEESEQKRRKEVLKRKYPRKVEVLSERAKAMRRTMSSAW
ncbi:hypothetical protein MLD38_017235 [Melastoma candidum]|uniref:Uncharacterized protein n=1 Tax=Melastoma candidum TaxID=119954 RepID=A0ACB9QR50_9MYRT|nr:hypothetical protein MLD38_017235 [Melastoma candidum]